MEFLERPYNHPDVEAMVAEVLTYYAKIYGGSGDDAVVEDDNFEGPNGKFYVAYEDGVRLGMSGWRRIEETPSVDLPWSPAAEIKRMYVVPEARGRGIAQNLLTLLEKTAFEAGIAGLVLETGYLQPEAIGLYTSRGYTPVNGAGWSYYHAVEGAHHMGRPLSPPEEPEAEL